MILVPLFPGIQAEYVGSDMRQFTLMNMVAKDYYLDRCMYNYNVYRKRK